MEAGAIMFHSPGWDMVFTVVYDDGSEIFGGCVYVSEVVPVCSVVVSVGTFWCGCGVGVGVCE